MTDKIKNFKNSELSMLFNEKTTENGDASFKSTGNKLIDILFKAEYYQRHLNEVTIGASNIEKLFAMFMRDPRNGMKYRDLGRVLMYQANVSPQQVVAAGRFDDLWKLNSSIGVNVEWNRYIIDECKKGNELAKKWMPHYVGKNKDGKVSPSTIAAGKMRAAYNFLNPLSKLNKQQYNKLVKVNTVESKLSQHKNDEIDFSKIPSLALLKYWARFNGTSKQHPNDDMKERFQAYLESVKKGDAKMNVSVTSVYDVYRNVKNIDADLVFDKLEKTSGNWLPIIDTSGSMFNDNDAIGKASAIAHYLAKTSTYCPNQVMTFSNRPSLITLGSSSQQHIQRVQDLMRWYSGNDTYTHYFNLCSADSTYAKELLSMYTGDCANSTNFEATMDILGNLQTEFPEYLVVLSDMEFNYGGRDGKDRLMQQWRSKGIETKIIWWNFNSRAETCPETDEYGNIFMSGYSPILLKYLNAGFDGSAFLAQLLMEYKNTLPEGIAPEIYNW